MSIGLSSFWFTDSVISGPSGLFLLFRVSVTNFFNHVGLNIFCAKIICTFSFPNLINPDL
jgi:hypothetical protein